MSTTDELAVFVKVVEEGSFTAASHTLQMPKSSISRNIARLENRLGVRLLHRTTRSLSTTEAGAGFYTHCVRIVAEIAEAEAALTEGPSSPRGPLSLSAPATLSPWLGTVLCDLLAAWPEVKLSVSGHGERDGADVIIATDAPEEALAVHALPGTARILCASPAYLARRSPPASPDALREHACLLLGTRAEGIWALPDGTIVPVSGPLASADCAILHRAVLAGLGIAWLPRVVLTEALADGALVELLAEHTRAASPLLISIVRPSATADALVDLLRARL